MSPSRRIGLAVVVGLAGALVAIDAAVAQGKEAPRPPQIIILPPAPIPPPPPHERQYMPPPASLQPPSPSPPALPPMLPRQ